MMNVTVVTEHESQFPNLEATVSITTEKVRQMLL